jgi:ribulose-bisphosphate carboxylase large chain
MKYRITPPLIGERFEVLYRLQGSEAEALAKAKDICIEQTVEFPEDLLPDGDIRDQIIGQIVDFSPDSKNEFLARISYPVEDAGGTLVQLLNVIFGNISIKPGIRVDSLDLSESILKLFKGPRFGRVGIRELVRAPRRPLLCTALKPMGLSTKDLANQAYQFALGGIDIIKDDHGLGDQPFCPFDERVNRCADAISEANQKSGFHAFYAPSLNFPFEKILEKAHLAKKVDVGGLLVAPALVGFDTMRALAEDDALGLPILSHPSFLGSYTINPSMGISHYSLFGQLNRLAGADATIYPNFGGRFSFSKEECAKIVEGCRAPMKHIAPIFPTPGGGVTMDRIPDMLNVYGRDLIVLIGGGLHRQGNDLVKTSRYFRDLVEKF